MDRKAVQLRIEGRVQGVGFRYSALKVALRYGVSGWVRNETDGTVSAYCEGSGAAVDAFVSWCRKGPSCSRVTRVAIKKLPFQGVYSKFIIDY